MLQTGWVMLTPPIINFLYYGGLLLGFLLAWRFHSSRIFFALIVLFLSQQAIGFLLPQKLPISGPGHAALQAAMFLVPLNFVLLSLARERGFAITTVSSTLIFLFVQSTSIARLAPAGPDYPSAAHSARHAAVSLLSSPYAWLVLGVASAVLLLRFMLLRKPAESALFWSLGSFVLALYSGGTGRTAMAYFATSSLILAVSIIE